MWLIGDTTYMIIHFQFRHGTEWTTDWQINALYAAFCCFESQMKIKKYLNSLNILIRFISGEFLLHTLTIKACKHYYKTVTYEFCLLTTMLFCWFRTVIYFIIETAPVCLFICVVSLISVSLEVVSTDIIASNTYTEQHKSALFNQPC